VYSGVKGVIGGIRWYADFEFDFGNPMNLKRIRWVKQSGEVTADTQSAVLVEADLKGRTTPVFPGGTYKTWASTQRYLDVNLGGLGRSFRIRLTGTDINNRNALLGLFPAVSGTVVHELQVEAEEVSAR